MKYYPDGDLRNLAPLLERDLLAQETLIIQLIDCIQELHARNEFHRDIKPQNFLLDGTNVVVSDFGLTTEIGSATAFTRSSVFWGTHGYIPPEFLTGGFKNADAVGDIFMLGKTIYNLLTNRDPLYLVGDDMPAPLFHVIERCCSIRKESRYQSLLELKQSVVAVYDVLVGRGGGIGETRHLLTSISDSLQREGKYYTDEISKFVETLSLLEEDDQIQICSEIPDSFYAVIGQSPVRDSLDTFLAIYEKRVERQSYSWSYAETIADNMLQIFSTPDVPNSSKTKALVLAIKGAIYMNRFAAMGTCIAMITGIEDGDLALRVAAVILSFPNSFVARVEPSACHSEPVRNAIRSIQKK